MDCNPECRACHYKDLDYPAQVERKQGWARRQLAPWANVLKEILAAPASEQLGYRIKSWMWFGEQEGQPAFGMLRSVRAGTRWEKEFVSWNDCPLHHPAIRRIVGRLRELWKDSVPAGVRQSLVGLWFGSPHFVVVSRSAIPEDLSSLDWARILEPPFDRAWFHHNEQVGAQVFGHRGLEPLAGPPLEPAVHPVRAFRQMAHTLLRQARLQAVTALLGPAPSLVLDLYCGTGDLSLLLPDEVSWVGIEQSREAVAFANRLRPEFDATRVHAAFEGAVEQRLADPQVASRIAGPWSLFLNPPRSGLSPGARDRLRDLLGRQPPLSVAFLSCSASGLARDLPLFEDCGFEVDLLQPYDFFPQTEHFETLALLSPHERS